MKKIICVLILVLVLTACGNGQPNTLPEDGRSLSGEYDWGITMSAEEVTPRGLTILCAQSGGQYTGLLMAGTPFSLDVWMDSGWQSVEKRSGDGATAWSTQGLGIQTNGVVEWPVDWTWLYGALAPGRYRISKWVTDQRAAGDYDECTYYVEFEIM